jgi:SWI/SNF-related matrix-associated actin-dependent regulator 1 of chromatin subfamily A
MKAVLDYRNDRFEIESGYDFRYIPKEAKFQWDPSGKVWHTSDPLKAAKLKNYASSIAMEKLDRLIFETINKSHATATNSELKIDWPTGLKSYPFQDAGIEWGMNHPSVLIADEMGLGKTIQAIGIVNQSKAKKVLVICPASVKINWKRELEKWLVEPLRVLMVSSQSKWEDADVYILNYDILKNFDAQIKRITWDVLIMDEVHYLKNSKTQRAKNIFGKWNKDNREWEILPIRARRRLALTGTPICNRPKELWPVVHYLCPQTFKSWRNFHERYANLQVTRWGIDISGSSNLEELQILLRSSCMIRRLKKQVLTELPAKIRQVIELPCGDDSNLLHLLELEQVAWNRYKKLTKNTDTISVTESTNSICSSVISSSFFSLNTLCFFSFIFGSTGV